MIDTVIQGDCVKVMKEFPVDCAELVLTDPPYNVANDSQILQERKGAITIINRNNKWDKDFNVEPFLEQSKRVLKSEGSIIVFTSDRLFGKYRDWFDKNMYFKQVLIWEKSNPIPNFRQTGYRNATEIILWASKEKITQDNPNMIFQGQEEMTNVFK